MLTEIGESSAENGNLITATLEYRHQSVCAFRDGQMVCYIFHHTYIQSLEQGYSACETFLEVYFSTHGTLGDGSYLFTNAGTVGQFIDAFRLDERRVHIKADETAHTAVHVITLEREVYLIFGGEMHEF